MMWSPQSKTYLQETITKYTAGYTRAALLELQITIHDDITNSVDALVITWVKKFTLTMGSSRDLKSQKYQVESSFENEKS